jgi:L-threonate 2-dehydrogenase
MNPTVSIMAQGGMGAATALVENGLEVRTILAGRSAASVQRASKAGMRDASEDECVGADFLLSIVPPAEAVPLAESLGRALARASKPAVYIDLNAINPATTGTVAEIIQAAGATFVDGGIIVSGKAVDIDRAPDSLRCPTAFRLELADGGMAASECIVS